jgi:hypothetical protein
LRPVFRSRGRPFQKTRIARYLRLIHPGRSFSQIGPYPVKNPGRPDTVLKCPCFIPAFIHSPKNILIKDYDDVLVVKVADFGLVRIPDSTFTSVNTAFKGYFNDPSLAVEGFDSYNILHEIYALTRLLYYVMTGKTNTDKILDPNLQTFVLRGLNSDKGKRFQNIEELSETFRSA